MAVGHLSGRSAGRWSLALPDPRCPSAFRVKPHFSRRSTCLVPGPSLSEAERGRLPEFIYWPACSRGRHWPQLPSAGSPTRAAEAQLWLAQHRGPHCSRCGREPCSPQDVEQPDIKPAGSSSKPILPASLPPRVPPRSPFAPDDSCPSLLR